MDGNTMMSPADIAALRGDNDFGGAGGQIWFLLIFVLLGGNGAQNGNNFGAMPNYVTSAEFQSGMNNQSIMSELNQLSLATQNNNYETLQAINQQTMALNQMNNTNQLTAISGFNNIYSQITNQTNTLASKLDQLGFQMQTCCCDIKTQMLQNRLDDSQRENLALRDQISNSDQTKDILSSIGRFVMYAGSGSPAATTGTGN